MAATVSLASAETAGKPEADAWRATPPKPSGKVAFKPPRVVALKLKNGVPVWVVERHDLPLVSVQVMVRAGSELASPDKAGLPSLVATMLDEGTATLSALDIAEKAESLGAQLSTGGSMEAAYVSLNALTETLDPSLDLLADVLMHPKFDAQELERVRNDRLADILQIKDSPRRLVGQLMSALVFGPGDPYGMPEIGTENSVKRITRDDVQGFYDAYYRPSRAMIVVSGDVKPKDIVARLEGRIGAWANPETGPGDAGRGAQKIRDGLTIYLLDRPGAPQAEVRVGTLGLSRTSPEYALAEVANNVFGGNFAARLNMNLREKNGYTYGAYSRMVYRRELGLMTAGGGIKSAVTAPALKEILAEINGLTERPPSAQELSLAKNSIVLSLAGLFESNAQIAATFGDLMVFGLPATTYEKLPAQVQKVTAKQVVEFAKDHWDTKQLVVGVIGPRADVEASLREVGKVEIVDDAAWKKLFP